MRIPPRAATDATCLLLALGVHLTDCIDDEIRRIQLNVFELLSVDNCLAFEESASQLTCDAQPLLILPWAPLSGTAQGKPGLLAVLKPGRHVAIHSAPIAQPSFGAPSVRSLPTDLICTDACVHAVYADTVGPGVRENDSAKIVANGSHA